MPWLIKSATPALAAALHNLAAATFPLACPPGLARQPIDQFIAKNLSEQAFLGYLADPLAQIRVGLNPAGDLLGYTMVFLREPTDLSIVKVLGPPPTAELSKCYVLPDQHGSGLAQALAWAAIDGASLAGKASIWLGVNQLNQRAQRFYSRLGFSQIGQRRFLVGEQLMDDYLMARPLGSGSELAGLGRQNQLGQLAFSPQLAQGGDLD